MNKILVTAFLVSCTIILSCDPKLFESEEEPLGPVLSEIYTGISNSQIMAGDSAEFWIEASNPGEGSLRYEWNVSDGYFLSPWDTEKVKWRAPFQGGMETIEIRVSNNDKTTNKTKNITVISLNTPIVNILSPKNEDYLVQYETINIEVEAFHDNDISHVEFFVNNESIGILNGNKSNIYNVSWVNEAPAGAATIIVAAVAKISGVIGYDLISVNIEGVVPGKK